MIRDIVLGSPGIMGGTKLKLFELNQLTISQWHNARIKRQEEVVLQPDIEPFTAPLVALEQLPPHRVLEASLLQRARRQQLSTAAPVPFASIATPIPVVGAPVPVAAPDEKRVPRTTAWRRKKLSEAAAAQGLNPKKRQIPRQFLCQKCGQPKTTDFGHSQFRDVYFCAKASGKTRGETFVCIYK
ncbi:hypothetical protein DPX16_15214 [Anabarilius grahami]|uniref:Uncharacterized protein n=1 Tax=Anabarilius grahami TaxID=495550 RepID=A0A3N0YIF5_ANAGA|nr:hypothetical protein DPX16_15214 [Anabarilius grahami]